MNLRWMSLITTMMLSTFALQTAHAAEKSGVLKINHTPVTWAVKGQSLTLKARISGGIGGIDNVTLYYALFRDAAPYRVTMASSGMDNYVGTIESSLLTGVEHLSYYIEAQDGEGTIEETPWYDVKFKNPESAPAVRGGDTTSSTGGTKPANNDEGMSAMTIGLIAGGAVAVGAGAYFLSDSGGGSDDDGGNGGGGGGGGGANEGNYAGNATTCLTLSGGQPACSTTAAQFVIDSTGKIFTDTLFPGKQLTGTLSGNDFSLVADVSNPEQSLTGTIVYSGTVVNESKIVGIVTGNADSAGVPGTYSGTFSATKQ